MMERIVDLTRELLPGKEELRLEIEVFQVRDYLPGFKQGKRDWHIVEDMHVSSHIGTHVEAPLHHLKNGNDVASLPLESLMGSAIRLDFRHKGRCGIIEAEDIRKHGEGIKKNDIVVLWTGWDMYYNKPEHLDRPSLAVDAAKLLIDKGIKCIGTDGSGIERATKDNLAQSCHHLLFKHNILIIEELTNLGEIRNERFTFWGLPLKIRHLDSSPIRAIAIEKQNETCPRR